MTVGELRQKVVFPGRGVKPCPALYQWVAFCAVSCLEAQSSWNMILTNCAEPCPHCPVQGGQIRTNLAPGAVSPHMGCQSLTGQARLCEATWPPQPHQPCNLKDTNSTRSGPGEILISSANRQPTVAGTLNTQC